MGTPRVGFYRQLKEYKNSLTQQSQWPLKNEDIFRTEHRRYISWCLASLISFLFVLRFFFFCHTMHYWLFWWNRTEEKYVSGRIFIRFAPKSLCPQVSPPPSKYWSFFKLKRLRSSIPGNKTGHLGQAKSPIHIVDWTNYRMKQLHLHRELAKQNKKNFFSFPFCA